VHTFGAARQRSAVPLASVRMPVAEPDEQARRIRLRKLQQRQILIEELLRKEEAAEEEGRKHKQRQQRRQQGKQASSGGRGSWPGAGRHTQDSGIPGADQYVDGDPLAAATAAELTGGGVTHARTPRRTTGHAPVALSEPAERHRARLVAGAAASFQTGFRLPDPDALSNTGTASYYERSAMLFDSAVAEVASEQAATMSWHSVERLAEPQPPAGQRGRRRSRNGVGAVEAGPPRPGSEPEPEPEPPTDLSSAPLGRRERAAVGASAPEPSSPSAKREQLRTAAQRVWHTFNKELQAAVPPRLPPRLRLPPRGMGAQALLNLEVKVRHAATQAARLASSHSPPPPPPLEMWWQEQEQEQRMQPAQ
jgi:hypothetical protein